MKSEKVTVQERDARRSYGDACGAAHALDLVGERWALLVMRELLLGPKRFSDLKADLPGVSANVLTQRLQDLESSGIVLRRRLPPPAPAQVYELTPWGYESEPIFWALGRWATRSPLHDPSLPLSAVSLMLSFRTMFDPDRAGKFAARAAFRFGMETYLVSIRKGRIAAERGSIDDADVAATSTPRAVAGAVYGEVPIGALEAEGVLSLEGDRRLFQTFTTLFPLPAKAGGGPAREEPEKARKRPKL